MITIPRFFVLVLTLVLCAHLVLLITHEEYGCGKAFSGIVAQLRGDNSIPSTSQQTQVPVPATDTKDWSRPNVSEWVRPDRLSVQPLMNATFVILARNSDLEGTVNSIREMEDRFNKFYGYPYVLLNEVEFTDEFKARISNVVSSSVEFGVIPYDDWYQPDWIDEEKAQAGRDRMVEQDVIYGESVSYRNMCRFNSGYFFRHPLMLKYRWYWRIEPDVHFHCDIHYDPFRYMEEHNKTYGFTITLYEFELTIETLWGHVKDFMTLYPDFVAKDNALGFLTDDEGETYNLCHFWSNFEIADMNMWRGPAYTTFFEYLDVQGGFYYERWGDAPVHSIAAAIFSQKDQIHFFDAIGYEHGAMAHCPRNPKQWWEGRCTCDQKKTYDFDGGSCMAKWERFMGLS